MKILRLPNLLLVIGWTAFVYFWGYLRWQRFGIFSEEAGLWNRAWWFDSLGHALAGVFLAVTLLYLFRNYAAQGFFRLAGKKVLAVVVVAIVTLLSFGWEAGEFLWDVWGQPYWHWLNKAQLGQIDTMIDWIVTTGCGILAVMLDFWYNKKYESRHPELYEAEEIESALQTVHELSQEILKKRRLMRKKFVFKFFRPLLPKMIEELEALSKTIKEINDENTHQN